MQKILFEEMMILSKIAKKAVRVKFRSGKNLILGENDVGKSTLIKSLYHSLGADAPKLDNSTWTNDNPIYCTKFSVGGVSYYIVRDERYFGFFNSEKKIISRHRGITKDEGIAHSINRRLNFNIELEEQYGAMQTASPAYYFLPFYIDQDAGWNNSWASFKGLKRFKNYRKEMIAYHLGIKSQEYYNALIQMHALDKKFTELSGEKSAFISVRDKYKSRKQVQKVDLDPEVFKKELEDLVDEYNKIYSKQQNQLGLIKSIRNKKLGIEGEIKALEASVSELDSDYEYLANPDTPDVFDCPTCNTEFHNSVSERFGLLDDMDYSSNLIDQKKKELILLEKQLKELNAEYATIAQELLSIQSLLEHTKENITLAEIIKSQSYKDMMESISTDINIIDAQQAELENKIESLKKDTKTNAKRKKEIVAFYQAKMNESLNKLNVVLKEDYYKDPARLVTANALGSDVPRIILAQYISLLHTMAQFNSFVHCPLIIDTPLQQDQDGPNTVAIFDFIFSSLLGEQQLILGTVGYGDAKISDDINVIELKTPYGLLSSEQYQDVYDEVAPLHKETLTVSE